MLLWWLLGATGHGAAAPFAALALALHAAAAALIGLLLRALGRPRGGRALAAAVLILLAPQNLEAALLVRGQHGLLGDGVRARRRCSRWCAAAPCRRGRPALAALPVQGVGLRAAGCWRWLAAVRARPAARRIRLRGAIAPQLALARARSWLRARLRPARVGRHAATRAPALAAQAAPDRERPRPRRHGRRRLPEPLAFGAGHGVVALLAFAALAGARGAAAAARAAPLAFAALAALPAAAPPAGRSARAISICRRSGWPGRRPRRWPRRGRRGAITPARRCSVVGGLQAARAARRRASLRPPRRGRAPRGRPPGSAPGTASSTSTAASRISTWPSRRIPRSRRRGRLLVLGDVPASFVVVPPALAPRGRSLVASPPLPPSGAYHFGDGGSSGSPAAATSRRSTRSGSASPDIRFIRLRPIPRRPGGRPRRHRRDQRPELDGGETARGQD